MMPPKETQLRRGRLHPNNDDKELQANSKQIVSFSNKKKRLKFCPEICVQIAIK